MLHGWKTEEAKQAREEWRSLLSARLQSESQSPMTVSLVVRTVQSFNILVPDCEIRSTPEPSCWDKFHDLDA
jgi:hypothetical protein